MPLVSMRQLLDHAAEHVYGLPAFNVNNMEQLHAVLGAAREVDSPAIVAASAVQGHTQANRSCAT